MNTLPEKYKTVLWEWFDDEDCVIQHVWDADFGTYHVVVFDKVEGKTHFVRMFTLGKIVNLSVDRISENITNHS